MVSKPLPILFSSDDNLLIYNYILFSATFVKQQKMKRSRVWASRGMVISLCRMRSISAFSGISRRTGCILKRIPAKGSSSIHLRDSARRMIFLKFPRYFIVVLWLQPHEVFRKNPKSSMKRRSTRSNSMSSRR